MDSELILTLKALKQKTSISVDVYSTNLTYKFSSGTRLNYELSSFDQDNFQDKKKDVTVFKFKFKKDEYIGVINGSGEVEKNYAMFITWQLENSGMQDDTLSKSEFLRGIVLGECNNMQIIKFMRKFSVPSVACYVILINCKQGQSDDVIDFLTNYTINSVDTAIALNEENSLYVKFITSENESEYQSSTDFAEVLCQSIYEEIGLKIEVGIGGVVKSLSECVMSYQQAVSALKISSIFNAKSNVHTYKEFILYKMLEEIPTPKLKEYYNMLVDNDAKTILEDKEMISTAEEFLENSLNISETARKLYMHRNTLMYRLDKIERSTSLNIKNFSDAVTFRLISLLGKLIEN